VFDVVVVVCAEAAAPVSDARTPANNIQRRTSTVPVSGTVVSHRLVLAVSKRPAVVARLKF